MHEEFKSVCVRNSDMVLIWNGTQRRRGPLMSSAEALKFRKAFNFVTNVKLLMDVILCNYRWERVLKFIEVAKQNGLHFYSIVMSRKLYIGHFHTYERSFMETIDPVDPAQVYYYPPNEFDLLPENVAGFRLVQLGRVFGVGFEGRFCYPFNGGPVRCNEYIFRHSVTRHDVHVYGANCRNVRRIGHEDAELLRLPVECPEHLLEKMLTGKANIIAEHWKKMRGWEELSEDQLSVSEAIVHVAEDDTASVEAENQELFTHWNNRHM
jgi:hypothetical protein